MNKTTGIKGTTAKPEIKGELGLQIAEYVRQQPESRQTFHKLMKRLEVVWMGVIVLVFIAALYISITWKSFDPTLIPIAWFTFVVSASLLAVLVGLHATMLGAFPPIVIAGKTQRLVSGREAVWAGLGTIVLGLTLVAFWGYFAYAVWTSNMAVVGTLISILGVLMGIGIAVSIVLKMAHTTFQKIFKTH